MHQPTSEVCCCRTGGRSAHTAQLQLYTTPVEQRHTHFILVAKDSQRSQHCTPMPQTQGRGGREAQRLRYHHAGCHTLDLGVCVQVKSQRYRPYLCKISRYLPEKKSITSFASPQQGKLAPMLNRARPPLTQHLPLITESVRHPQRFFLISLLSLVPKYSFGLSRVRDIRAPRRQPRFLRGASAYCTSALTDRPLVGSVSGEAVRPQTTALLMQQGHGASGSGTRIQSR